VSALTSRVDRDELRVLRVEGHGAVLHCEIAGAGPAVLLLHGFTGSTRTMDGVAAGLRAAGFRTIAVDAPGHGQSNAPDDVSAYTLEHTVAGLAAVLDAAAEASAAVLGYSMGARAALGLALLHPERVSALVMVGGSAGLEDPEARAVRRRSDEALADFILQHGVPAFVGRWMGNPLLVPQARLGRGYLAQARAQRLANRPHGLALSLRGFGAGAQPPLFDRLPGLAAPLFLVVGEEDQKFCAIAQDLGARTPRARVAVIPRAGHAAHVENPAIFLQELCGFLATPPTDTAKGRR